MSRFISVDTVGRGGLFHFHGEGELSQGFNDMMLKGVCVSLLRDSWTHLQEIKRTGIFQDAEL